MATGDLLFIDVSNHAQMCLKDLTLEKQVGLVHLAGAQNMLTFGEKAQDQMAWRPEI